MGDFQSLLDCFEYILVGGAALTALHAYFNLERGAKRNKVYTIGEEERNNLDRIYQDIGERIEQIEQYPELCGRPQCSALVMAQITLRSTDYRNKTYVAPDELDYVFDVCRRWPVAEKYLPSNLD